MIKPITYISNNEFKLYSPIIQSPFEKIIKKTENIMPKIDPMNKLVNTMNQSLYQKNFNIIYKEESIEENNKENENKIDND